MAEASRGAQAALQGLLQSLQCPLCEELFKKPHTFGSCGHTFCYTCVIDTLEGPGIIKSQCPTCNQPGWKKDLVFNHVINNAVEQVSALQSSVHDAGACKPSLRDKMRHRLSWQKSSSTEAAAPAEAAVQQQAHGASCAEGAAAPAEAPVQQQAQGANSAEGTAAPAEAAPPGRSSGSAPASAEAALEALERQQGQQQRQQEEEESGDPAGLQPSPLQLYLSAGDDTTPAQERPLGPTTPSFFDEAWAQRMCALPTPSKALVERLLAEVAALDEAIGLCDELPCNAGPGPSPALEPQVVASAPASGQRAAAAAAAGAQPAATAWAAELPAALAAPIMPANSEEAGGHSPGAASAGAAALAAAAAPGAVADSEHPNSQPPCSRSEQQVAAQQRVPLSPLQLAQQPPHAARPAARASPVDVPASAGPSAVLSAAPVSRRVSAAGTAAPAASGGILEDGAQAALPQPATIAAGPEDTSAAGPLAGTLSTQPEGSDEAKPSGRRKRRKGASGRGMPGRQTGAAPTSSGMHPSSLEPATVEAALAHHPAADTGPGPDRQPLQLAQREGGSACPATEGPRPEAQQVTGQQPSLNAAAAMVVSESEHEDDLGPPAAPQAALQAGSEVAGAAAAAADGHTLAGAAVGELAPPAAAAEAEAQPQGRGGGLKPAWKRRKAEREMEQAEKLVSALLPTKCPENHQQLQQPHLPPPQLQPEQLAAQPLHGHAEQPQEGAQEQGPQGEGAHAPPAAPQQQQQQLSGNGLVNARVRVKWIEGWFTGRVAMYMSYTDKHYIIYDDGDRQWHALREDEWELLQLPQTDAAGARHQQDVYDFAGTEAPLGLGSSGSESEEAGSSNGGGSEGGEEAEHSSGSSSGSEGASDGLGSSSCSEAEGAERQRSRLRRQPARAGRAGARAAAGAGCDPGPEASSRQARRQRQQPARGAPRARRPPQDAALGKRQVLVDSSDEEGPLGGSRLGAQFSRRRQKAKHAAGGLGLGGRGNGAAPAPAAPAEVAAPPPAAQAAAAASDSEGEGKAVAGAPAPSVLAAPPARLPVLQMPAPAEPARSKQPPQPGLGTEDVASLLVGLSSDDAPTASGPASVGQQRPLPLGRAPGAAAAAAEAAAPQCSIPGAASSAHAALQAASRHSMQPQHTQQPVRFSRRHPPSPKRAAEAAATVQLGVCQPAPGQLEPQRPPAGCQQACQLGQGSAAGGQQDVGQPEQQQQQHGGATSAVQPQPQPAEAMAASAQQAAGRSSQGTDGRAEARAVGAAACRASPEAAHSVMDLFAGAVTQPGGGFLPERPRTATPEPPQASPASAGRRVLVLANPLGPTQQALVDCIYQLRSLGRAEHQTVVTGQTTHVLVLTDDHGRAQQRTLKYMQGVVRGCWVVSTAWLDACREAGMWVPEKPFEVKGDTLALGAPQKARAQRLGGDGGLFEGVSAFVYGSGTPSGQNLARLLEGGGARVVGRLPSGTELGRTKIIVPGNEADSSVRKAARELRAKTERPVLRSEWVFDSVSNWRIMPEKRFYFK